MKIALLTFSFCCIFNLKSQQNYTSIMMDNYVSSNLASFNPSSIVDSKTKFAFTSGINYNSTSNFFAKNYAPYNNYSGGFFDGIKGKYVDPNKTGFQNINFNIDIINLKFEINHNNAIGYALRGRAYSNRSGIPEIWSKNVALNYIGNELNSPENLTGYTYNQVEFTEHAFTYARTIFDRKQTFFKMGATFKVLNGLSARHFSVNSGTLEFLDDSSSVATFKDLDADYGKNSSEDQLFFSNRGFGFDIGGTFEFRPNIDKQFYEMDGNSKNIRWDINKYKLKIGASVTDIGSIKFEKDPTFYNFTNASQNVTAESIFKSVSLGPAPFLQIQDSLQKTGVKSTTQNSQMKMNMPTTAHLNIDYYIKKNYYVSYNVSIPIYSKSDKTVINNTFIQTITPRIESNNYSFMMPISHQSNGKFYFGLAGRMVLNKLTMFAGSNNASIIFGQKSSLTRNFFIGTIIHFPYEIPSDIDGDKVSDKKDICPLDFGVIDYYGCPDTDGDEIPDKEDLCIYNKGTRETNGCPDTDGDGIIDMNDLCPNVAGLGVHYGCPDRDFDGVIDMADKCPDVPGIELNNGCPFENPGCCMDNDGDGVSNNVDKCPDYAGSVYNEGCPIDSLNINKIGLNEKKVELDPNNTADQIKVLKNNDTIRNFITTKEDLKQLTENKNVLGEHNIYFNTDQATITPEEQGNFDRFFAMLPYDASLTLMVIGYTDKDGSLDYNLILSRKRAETVKRKLIENGYPADKIVLYYYGEAKSLKKGSYTDEQKQMDRRVEIKIIKN